MLFCVSYCSWSLVLQHLSSPQTGDVLLISLIQALSPKWFRLSWVDNSREALQSLADLGAEEISLPEIVLSAGLTRALRLRSRLEVLPLLYSLKLPPFSQH